MASTRELQTAHGTIRYPTYIPVTTFGDAYPLDALIQPYLPRLATAVMVSFHYAQMMKQRPRIPVLIDSGGFAALFDGAEVRAFGDQGILAIRKDEQVEELSPLRVLDFQEQHADVAFTLDFPIPPGMDACEAENRRRLTVANAVWALSNRRRRDMALFAGIQGLDVDDYLATAGELSSNPLTVLPSADSSPGPGIGRPSRPS